MREDVAVFLKFIESQEPGDWELIDEFPPYGVQRYFPAPDGVIECALYRNEREGAPYMIARSTSMLGAPSPTMAA
jgi:hypothetical protein